MLPHNLNLSTGKTVGYNSQLLISDTNMIIVPNKD